MELTEKVTRALTETLQPKILRLEDEEGITGFVVSDKFRAMRSLERQELIDKILRESPLKFSKSELRRVVLIACLTPVEYATLGPAADDNGHPSPEPARRHRRK